MGILGHFLVPGYAQLRNGDRTRALLVGAAVAGALAIAAATRWLHSPIGLLSFLASLIAIAVGSCVDGRLRRKGPARVRARDLLLLAVPPWAFVAVLCITPAREALLGLSAYRIPAGHESMAPTLRGGDRFLVDKACVPGRGDLVVFVAPPEDQGKTFIKRVVALEGDVVRAGADGVEVNGRLAVQGRADPFGPVTVPNGRLFVVGDNLQDSRDSRQFGTVEKAAIRGRVLYVFWSDTWSRIGTTPR